MWICLNLAKLWLSVCFGAVLIWRRRTLPHKTATTIADSRPRPSVVRVFLAENRNDLRRPLAKSFSNYVGKLVGKHKNPNKNGCRFMAFSKLTATLPWFSNCLARACAKFVTYLSIFNHAKIPPPCHSPGIIATKTLELDESMTRQKVFFGGVKNATFQDSWGLLVNKHFVAIKIKQNPQNHQMFFTFWGGSFPYIPKNSIVFLGGWPFLAVTGVVTGSLPASCPS